MIEHTGLSRSDILSIARNAPQRYKTYTISKRNGGKRTISQPAREVKVLQKILLEHVLYKLPVHSAATAYRQGISLKENATRHVHNESIKKFDFKDFFPSIKGRDWIKYCGDHGVFADTVDVGLSTHILFHQPANSTILRLAIGAPSSPALSNVLMFEFDKIITDEVAKDEVIYTRYADDLTFSASRMWNMIDVPKVIARAIKNNHYPRLNINPDKTISATKKYKRQVTGLILTNDGKVSLGRKRKREIRAEVHRALIGQLTNDQLMHVQGILAFVEDVEPDYLRRLESYYGAEFIRNLRKRVRE
ncbi:retron St85 family RNA-directed DNA polymerase [Sphingobium sp. SYK-6]|uniref:retron St85 family RNA-directed DNA polymerase n=1 Tax=Sphingobium sp. (strain NBRC 103272 / SYK-6) TaxID=627192 RepID=UPI0013146253|nr:retron St85 family RNA-directed DNA polymerase [Sphingobium sp. SYK-6]